MQEESRTNVTKATGTGLTIRVVDFSSVPAPFVCLTALSVGFLLKASAVDVLDTQAQPTTRLLSKGPAEDFVFLHQTNPERRAILDTDRRQPMLFSKVFQGERPLAYDVVRCPK